VLAFFVPGIAYLADAVGTQTQTVVIRGLSVGVGLRQMARPEKLEAEAIGAAVVHDLELAGGKGLRRRSREARAARHRGRARYPHDRPRYRP
jgi:hypothetical protein